jgi:hypothetical protein
MREGKGEEPESGGKRKERERDSDRELKRRERVGERERVWGRVINRGEREMSERKGFSVAETCGHWCGKNSNFKLTVKLLLLLVSIYAFILRLTLFTNLF